MVYVGWFVCRITGLHKNYMTDFCKSWMADGSQARIEPINFWSGSMDIF